METISETIRNPAILHWIHDNPLLVLREQCQLKGLDGDEIQIRTGEPAALSERHTIIKHRNPKTGEVVDKVLFDLHGLSTEEAAERVSDELRQTWVDRRLPLVEVVSLDHSSCEDEELGELASARVTLAFPQNLGSLSGLAPRSPPRQGASRCSRSPLF